MAERAAAARKRRQRQAVIGSAIAVVVVAGVAVWLVSSLKSDDKKASASPAASASAAAAPPAPAGTANCTWTPQDPSSGGKIVKTGVPPTNVPKVGTQTLTMTTNLGVITADVDLSKAPCTAAAFDFLSAKKFWDGTKCHRLVTSGISVLQCGDPSAKGKGYRATDGTGGPDFMYAEENLPTGKTPPYPAGTLAMAKTQNPGTTGSQFFIVYADTTLDPSYTILGTVTKGLDIVKAVAKAGSDNANAKGDGHPKKEVDITSLKMS